jgi:hypothetical protein
MPCPGHLKLDHAYPSGYRALGRIQDGVMYWFWIGKHDEYERLLKGI